MNALVMAGGKATRMGSCEKPLIKICGEPMIERVIRALRESKHIDDIIIVTSKFTSQTSKLMRKDLVKVIETSGEDYHIDIQMAIKELALLSPVMIISADLPLITNKLIDEIVDHYIRCEKPALMVAVRAQAYEDIGLKPEYVIKVNGELLVPVGINIIDGKYVNEPIMEQEILVLDSADQVVNVNTWTDLEIAEKLYKLNFA